MPFQKIVKLAADAVKQVAGATTSPRGRGMIAALQQGQSAPGSNAVRKKKITEAARKAAGAVARPLTFKKGGMAKKSTVKAKARKK